MADCNPCNPNEGPWAGKDDPLGPLSCDEGEKDDGGGDGGDGDGCGLTGPFGPGCSGWTPRPGECPAPPINPQVVSPFMRGVFDLRWDNPAILAKNGKYQIVGVNIYRSDTSERGPYRRLNAAPVGGTFYRDFSNNVLVQNEIVDWNSAWLSRGHSANSALWKFRTCHQPIVKADYKSTPANSMFDVQVLIDGVRAEVDEVFGPTGEVTLRNVAGYDIGSKQWVAPVLPTGPESTVVVTYRYPLNTVRTDLDKKIWYRITTVGVDPSSPTGYRETPLMYTEPATFRAVESMDYIWSESVRRNNWILEQGGERVKVFIRKTSGQPCFCERDPRTMEYSKQPLNNCPICFGTGFVGGYEGPYDMIVGPDDSPRSVRQTPQGRFLDHQQDVWTGPSPLLTQRDFIVKQTNERYSIGPVHKPSNRGNILQQHLQIKYLDEQDIRYTIPLFDTTELCWPECRGRPAVMQGRAWMTEYPATGPYPVGANYQQTPMETEKENIPDPREQRGRTPVWENITYGLLPLMFSLNEILTHWTL